MRFSLNQSGLNSSVFAAAQKTHSGVEIRLNAASNAEYSRLIAEQGVAKNVT
jgi:hypothetical protein